MRVVTYSRVSKTDEDQNPDIQTEALRRYCVARGWTIVEEFVEKLSVSEPRPCVDKIHALVAERQIQAVVVTKLDRMFRSAVEMLTAIRFWDGYGTIFVAADQQIDPSTPLGRAFIGILAVFAEFELNMIRERTKAGLAYRKLHGPKPGKKPIGRPRRLITIQIHDLYHRQGLTLDEIRARMKCGIGTVHRALKRKMEDS